MPAMTRFWQSLETVRGGATLPAQWRHWMGADEYALVETLFRPTGELATWFPHQDPELFYYRVIEHGPDDYVGVCDETGQRVPIPTADLAIHRLNHAALQRAVAGALGLVVDLRPIDETVAQIGRFEPAAGVSCPAFWTIPAGPDELARGIERLAVRQSGPFLLLAPTRRFLTTAAEDWLRMTRGRFLALEESVARSESGHWTATQTGQDAVEQLRWELVPQATADGAAVFFPTPPGATWSQVRIRLTDGHTLAASVGAAHGVFHYAQMGLVNRKNGAPSVQWELLRAFAAGAGRLTWRSPQADRRNQKRRELLARALRRFFRIDSDPFVPHDNGWRARFGIEADSAAL